MKKVVYYNIDDNLDFENNLLKQWGVNDLELVEVKNGEDQHKNEVFLECVKDADGVVVEYFQVTKDVLEKMDKVKIVSVQAIGYSGLDTKAATDCGIVCTNAPGFCSEEVAVHTVGMMLDCIRNISRLDRTVRAGAWDPLKFGINERLSGKTVGLVFFGSIPQYMVPIMKAMDLKVTCYAPSKTKEYLAQFGVEKIETLEELLKTSDFVSMHCPLVKEAVPGRPATFHIIGEKEFKMMKPNAYLINTARGPVIDEAALVKALKEGWIRGAAVDVIEDEASEKSELFELDNCIITPHAAFVSQAAFDDARIISLKQQVELLHDGKLPKNCVNKDVKSKAL